METNSSRLGVTNVKIWNMSTSWAIESEAFCSVLWRINLGKWNKDEKDKRGKCQLYLGLREFTEFTVFNKNWEASIRQLRKTQVTQQLGRWINRGDKSRRYWNKQYYTVARVVLGPIINEIVLRLCDIFMGDLLLFGFCISILHQKELSWIPGLHTLTCSPWVFHKNIRSVCALILFSSKIYMPILLKCSYEH